MNGAASQIKGAKLGLRGPENESRSGGFGADEQLPAPTPVFHGVLSAAVFLALRCQLSGKVTSNLVGASALNLARVSAINLSPSLVNLEIFSAGTT